MLLTAYILAVGLLGWGRGQTHTAALSRTARGLLTVCTLELLIFGFILALACQPPVRVPVVLTVDELKQVLSAMTRTPQLVAKLLHFAFCT